MEIHCKALVILMTICTLYHTIEGCYVNRNLLGTWLLGDGMTKEQKGSITFDATTINVHFNNKQYEFVCSARDYNGKYLFKTLDEEKMLCVLLTEWDSQSLAMIKMDAGHFATTDDFFKGNPIPSGYQTSIDSCGQYPGDTMLILEVPPKD